MAKTSKNKPLTARQWEKAIYLAGGAKEERRERLRLPYATLWRNRYGRTNADYPDAFEGVETSRLK